jgi:hypothetical protein
MHEGPLGKKILVLEANYSFEHKAIELATVADIGRLETFVLLIHVLYFGQNVFGDKPAAGSLDTVEGNG